MDSQLNAYHVTSCVTMVTSANLASTGVMAVLLTLWLPERCAQVSNIFDQIQREIQRVQDFKEENQS